MTSSTPPFAIPEFVHKYFWRMNEWRGRNRVPLSDRAARALFFSLPMATEAWQSLCQSVFREPAFRGRCDSLGTGLRLRGALPTIQGDGPISIGDRLDVATPGYWLAGMGLPTPARLDIGSDVYIGPYHIFFVARGLRIGNYCRIAPMVAIYDNDMHPRDAELRRINYGTMDRVASAPVVVEDDAWLGIRATVLKGVRIGKGAIVGAGAVVTRDVPDYAIVAGNPARVVGDARE